MQVQTTYSVFSTDWGHMIAVWSDRGLWELSFPRPYIEEARADIVSPLDKAADSMFDEQLKQELNMYFKGFNLPFSVPIDWRKYTPFQERVLKYTAAIPYGRLMTYGTVAETIGSPKAARAVGGALHINRTPIVVPCHRVIGSNGKLTGFGGGIEMKKALLILEKNIASDLSDRI